MEALIREILGELEASEEEINSVLADARNVTMQITVEAIGLAVAATTLRETLEQMGMSKGMAGLAAQDYLRGKLNPGGA